MSKEWFEAAHDELIEEYLEQHPEADWQRAYEATAGAAYERMTDNMAAAADWQHDRMKEGY